jgi:GT2 family glycosyltransferase
VIDVTLAAAVASGAAEIVVIDDNSADKTAELVTAWRQSTSSVRLFQAGPLPPQWTGKNHAVAVGAAHATQPWLLFLDADAQMLGGALERVFGYVEQHKLEALSLSPEQQMRSLWERAVLPVVFAELAAVFPFDVINDAASPLAAANGQFILIRRAAYEKIGGHAAIASEVLEDVRLAERIKRAGLRYQFAPGYGLVRSRMYRDWHSQWEGWSKNLSLLFGNPATSLRFYRLLAPAALLVAVSTVLALQNKAVTVGLVATVIAVHVEYAWRLLCVGRLKSALDNGEPRASRWGGKWRGALALLTTVALLTPGATAAALMWINSEVHRRRHKAVSWKGRRYSLNTPGVPDRGEALQL